jgi:hypothetical protein
MASSKDVRDIMGFSAQVGAPASSASKKKAPKPATGKRLSELISFHMA